MDYSGLINLALVTIIYSTFIAPNLQKLGEIRDSVADVDFPVQDGQDETLQSIQEKGIALEKKLTQYSDKYSQVTKFLRYFYAIIVLLLTFQVALLVHTNQYAFTNILSLAGAIVVILLLVFTVRTHMTKPWKVRSLSWLAGAGIAPVHLYTLLKPEVAINNNKANIVLNDKYTRVSLLTGMHMVGYRHILTIENDDATRLYFVSAGLNEKYAPYGPVVDGTGLRVNENYLATANLKPGKYRARLVIFTAPFGGTVRGVETVIDFDVPDSGPVATAKKKIPIGKPAPASPYKMESMNGKVGSLEVNEGFDSSRAITNVLASRAFRRLFRKNGRPFTIESYYGTLTKAEIDMFCSRRNHLRTQIKRLIRRPKKRARLLRLTNFKNF